MKEKFYFLINTHVSILIIDMNGELWKTIKDLFTRDLETNPLETFLFLFIIFGFFGGLVFTYHLSQKKEKQRLAESRENKWRNLTYKYNLSDKESEFLEELALRLKMPDKKYLLIADHNTFHHALSQYKDKELLDPNLVKSIIEKTGMQEAEQIITEIPTQRRKSKRIRVDTDAFISPIEEETARMKARMYDLSKGGCSIENPSTYFNSGDDIKITFVYNKKRYKDIPAEVVKTSAGGRKLHISFGHVRKA